MGEFVEYETPICCMQRLTRQDNSDKFKFILKFPKTNTNDSEILTTINKARIISKKVNEIIEIDPTLCEYIIEISNQDCTNDDEESKEFIQVFENLLKSTEEKITITTEDDKKLQKIRFLLGETTSDELQHEMTSIDESISYLNTNQHDHSIEFLSTKMKTLIESGEFFKLDEKISIEIIDSYFYHQNQKKKKKKSGTEINDEIIEIFNGLKEKENETVVMHFLLQLEYSSYTNEMREYISDNLFDDVVNNELGLIINQFREQLLKPIEKSDKDKKMIQFLFHENHEFDGIIKYLLNQSGDDIDKYMNITSSSVENDKNIPINAVLFDDEDSYFATKNIQNSWICFDFKDHKIIPNNYSICSYFGMIGTCHPKSWVIEGCNDEYNWEIIDEQKNSDKLNDTNITHTFVIQNPQQKSFRYIRLRETDSNWNNSYNLCFNAIEFYGYLI